MSENNSLPVEVAKAMAQSLDFNLKKEILGNCTMVTNKIGKKKLFTTSLDKMTEWEYEIKREGNYFIASGKPSRVVFSRLYTMDLKYKTCMFKEIHVQNDGVYCIDLYGNVTLYSLDLKTSEPKALSKKQ